MRKKVLLPLTTLFMTVLITGNAESFTSHTILLRSDNISKYAPKDSTLGAVYVMKFDVPEEYSGRELATALLEFYVDAFPREEDGYEDETRVIEVYQLKGSYSGVVDSTQFVYPSHMIRNVRLGNSRKLRWDITKIIRDYLKNPSKNFGFIMGSLSGSRRGVFVLRDDVVASNACAKVTFFFKD